MGMVKLFATPSSPFSLRIVWALKFKGIDYEIIYEDLSNKSPELLRYNPIHKKIPVLVHNEVPICESLVILEYIDETWKDTSPYLPQDPFEKAKARFWAKFGDEQVIPSFYGYYMKQGKDQEEAKVTILANLKLIEELLYEKTFFNGETCGFLDLALGWLADCSGPLEVVTGLKLLDEYSFPNLCAWRKKFLQIPSKIESWPDQETLIVMYTKMKERRKSEK
uniref:probable glutathione S-transferase n=1 Tax=Erigeron canadensis TaxID=72917 RepID=UPI001CB91CF8|nr:probable glutathione S-transferase [Erigeron canadensis]